MSDKMPEDLPDRMPEDMPEDMPEHMPEDMPDRMPEDMSDRMPEDLPDRMPDRMPEDMSDRMPEDLPVRKCINVMVGITRSKVISPLIAIWIATWWYTMDFQGDPLTNPYENCFKYDPANRHPAHGQSSQRTVAEELSLSERHLL